MWFYSLTYRVLLALAASFAAVSPASAVTIWGVEFTDWTTIEATPGTNLEVSTDEDVYIFAPDSIYFDTFDLTAIRNIFIFADLHQNDPLLCATGCTTEIYDLIGDVIISISGPLGSVTINTPRAAVFNNVPIPEPSTALLLATGLSLIALQRRRPRRLTRRCS